MKGTLSDVRFLLVLLAGSLGLNVFLARRVWTSAPARPRVPTEAEFKDALAKQRRQTMPIPQEASVVVVKFNDYQCPPCRLTHERYTPVIARLQGDHPGAIKLLVKDFPLAAACNAAVTGSLHPAACDAAAAVRLARRGGKEAEMSDWLFAHQPSLTPDSVRAALRSITGRDHGADEYEAALAEVKQDAALGARLGVASTPTFFVNGMRVEAPTARLFEVALEYELARTGREAHR
jgi:protein-disulfide isomerase